MGANLARRSRAVKATPTRRTHYLTLHALNYRVFPVSASTGMPLWIGVVMALSLLVIAGSFVAMAFILRHITQHVTRQSATLSQELGELRAELRPTLLSLAAFTTEGQKLTSTVQREVEALVATSEGVRKRVDSGVTQVRRRLEDLDALYGVVYEEVEDTALAVAATLRTARTGAGILARVKYLLGRIDEDGVAEAVAPRRRARKKRKRSSRRSAAGA